MNFVFTSLELIENNNKIKIYVKVLRNIEGKRCGAFEIGLYSSDRSSCPTLESTKHTYLLKTVVLEVIHLFLDVISKIVFTETLSELGIHIEIDGIVGDPGSVLLELLID